MADLAKLARWARKAVSVPPHDTARRISHRTREAFVVAIQRRRDRQAATYRLGLSDPGALRRRIHTTPLDLLVPHSEAIAGVSRHYLDHRFDLLGSGWVVVRHGMPCAGVEGHRYESGPVVQADPEGEWLSPRGLPPNTAESRRIWQMVDPGYRPIDWHLDFKSGWRWSELTWYRDIEYGGVAGADIKVPWELARMQHLPQLANAAALAALSTDGFALPDRYAREFRNQVLDFIATNPPRFGVNWATPMEVAIRVVNWLAAFDLFRSSGIGFDQEFESVLRRSVIEHGEFIAKHLEWSPGFRGNHYLANIVGLLFVGAYLPQSERADAWLAFAVQEIVVESASQFTNDGANFEGSTCYHRLSGEMLVYATALILGLDDEKRAALTKYHRRHVGRGPKWRPDPVRLHDTAPGLRTPVPRWLLEQLERIAEFTVDITKPHGRVAQIGDNDSGRLLKPIPIVQAHAVGELRSHRANLAGYDGLPDHDVYWDEEHLDHRPLVAAVNGLFGRADLAEFAGDLQFESALVTAFAGRQFPATYKVGHRARSEGVRSGEGEELLTLLKGIQALPVDQRRRIEIPLPESIGPPLRLLAYPDFGIFVARSEGMYLAMRCGPIGQKGLGGHAHNDQLAVELTVDGEDWIHDPGTYVYTALPKRRDDYRSVRSHFVPTLLGGEPSRLDLGPFEIGPGTHAHCIYWGPLGFAGRLTMSHKRELTCVVEWANDRITLTYGAKNCSFEGGWASPVDWRALVPDVAFSPGYGIQERQP